MSNVRDFGTVGDGKTDDTSAILHAVQAGNGFIEFPRGDYLITQTIEIPLDQTGRLGIDGNGGTARVVMAGKGPAFRLVGTHGGTGDPNSVKPNVATRQRMPTVRDIEVTATNAEADGFELVGTMQPIFEGVLVRGVRHGIRLHQRNRNVLINDCHIYYNTGVGIFLDEVNLHQINICGNHISYNRLGGIRIQGSEIRNLQITGNDIEYNNHRQFGTDPEPTAEIYIDTTDEKASVNEITVASNTIQATSSPNGANLRIIDTPGPARPPGLWSVTGNIIGSQENNVHLTGCHGVVLTGNFIYSCENRNLLMERCSQMNVTGNSFRRHTPSRFTGIRIVESQDIVLSGCTVQDEDPDGQKSKASLLELSDCRRVNVQGSQFLDGAPFGIHAERCHEINITGCTVSDTRETLQSQSAIRFQGAGSHNLISSCTIGKAKGDALHLDDAAKVTVVNSIGMGLSRS